MEKKKETTEEKQHRGRPLMFPSPRRVRLTLSLDLTRELDRILAAAIARIPPGRRSGVVADWLRYLVASLLAHQLSAEQPTPPADWLRYLVASLPAHQLLAEQPTPPAEQPTLLAEAPWAGRLARALGGAPLPGFAEAVLTAIESLEERERAVLELRYGLRDGKARTLQEVGQELGITRERVRQIEARAIRRLRHPAAGVMRCLRPGGPDDNLAVLETR